MKLILLTFLIFIVGCGDVIVGDPKGATTADTTEPLEEPKDSGSSVAAEPKAEPAKSSPDACGDSYKAKVVYEDKDQKLYACIQGSGDSKPTEAPGSPSGPQATLLTGCPYTAEPQKDGTLKLTYQIPEFVKEPYVVPSYVLHEINFREIGVGDYQGGWVCSFIFWKGGTLVYKNAEKVYEKNFDL